MVLGFLGTIDAGLKALDIPHGKGALEAASVVLADLAGAKAGLTSADKSVDKCCG
jgi:alanine-glyoxylate transaminase/serine-glyoxylate transaminase/serine-pyruvate transaminase